MRTWVGTGMRGILCALAGGVIIGVIPRSMFARGWGDSTEGRPAMQVFKSSDYQSNTGVTAAAQDRDGMLYFFGDGLLPPELEKTKNEFRRDRGFVHQHKCP